MKTMKKTIAALLLLCMLTALCGAGAYADSTCLGTLTLTNPNISLDLNGKKSDSVGQAVQGTKYTTEDYNGGAIATWTWTSKDEELVTVDVNGTVTATGNKTGSTTCSVKAEKANGDYWTGSVNVTVTDSSKVLVSSITITAPTNVVTAGGTLQLTATVAPEDATNKSVAWSVDPDAAVTVDKDTGLVTGNANAVAGTTVLVTATALDGSKVSNQYAVTIKAADPIPATDFYFEDSSDVILNPNSSVCRSDKLRFLPTNATTGMNVTWSITGNESNVVSFDATTGTVTNDKGLKSDAVVYVNATLVGTSITRSYKVTAKAVALDSMTITYNSQMATTETSGQSLVAKDSSGNTLAGVTYTITGDTTSSGAYIADSTLYPGSKASMLTIQASKDGYKNYTFTVTVIESSSSGIAVTVVPTSSYITSKNGVVTLTATITQNGKAYDGFIEWSIAAVDGTWSNGATIEKVDGNYGTGVHKANVMGLYNGNYVVTATVVNEEVTSDCPIYVRFTPTIVEGNNAIYNGKDPLYFIVNDHIYNFDGNVYVDGVLLTAGYHYDYYSSPDGRILIGLRAGFLSYVNQNSSSNAYHSISIGDKYATGATGYFRTWGTASSSKGVKTGDDSNLALWTAMLVSSAVTIGAATVITKRRKDL